MKIVSWNVNGLRAILVKNCKHDIRQLDPDILCLQEIKVKPAQLRQCSTWNIGNINRKYN
jgi:exodeoxyribonuclease-3